MNVNQVLLVLSVMAAREQEGRPYEYIHVCIHSSMGLPATTPKLGIRLWTAMELLQTFTGARADLCDTNNNGARGDWQSAPPKDTLLDKRAHMTHDS